MEVVKTTPVLGKADSLGLLKVRIEGNAHYGSLSRLFALMKAGHPDFSPPRWWCAKAESMPPADWNGPDRLRLRPPR